MGFSRVGQREAIPRYPSRGGCTYAVSLRGRKGGSARMCWQPWKALLYTPRGRPLCGMMRVQRPDVTLSLHHAHPQ